MKFKLINKDNDKSYKLKDYETSEDEVNPKDESKRDVVAVIVCVFLALVIWLMVSNAQANNITPKGNIFTENHIVASDIT